MARLRTRNINNNNTEELYNFAKERFDIEVNRFYALEKKARNLLASQSLLVGFIAYLVKYSFENYISMMGKILDYTILIIVALLILIVLFSWVCSFISFNKGDLYYPVFNVLTIRSFLESKRDLVFKSFAVKYKDLIDLNQTICDDKDKFIRYSYISSMVSVVIFLILLIIIVVKRINFML